MNWGLGTGDWGLGTGDWGLGTGELGAPATAREWGLGAMGTGDWGIMKNYLIYQCPIPNAPCPIPNISCVKNL
ncbi:hypothetical protein JYQ62_30280 [Nostoc sp. UHCC 0702]|nr:hypothetical protein JYQ62_30280 [Nostoc sp. UHCC 0702]